MKNIISYDLEEGEIPNNINNNNLANNRSIKRKRDDYYDSRKNIVRDSKSNDRKNNSHNGYRRNLEIEPISEDRYKEFASIDLTEIFPFPINDYRIIRDFPLIKSHPLDYIRFKDPNKKIFIDWCKYLDNNEIEILP